MKSTKVSLKPAAMSDAPAIASLRTAVAERLTRDFGDGPWSSPGTEKGVLYTMRNASVFAARQGTKIIGVLVLATKKPWAIDTKYFSPCARPLYLTGMAVDPEMQREGIGRAMLEDVQRVVREWPGDAIRLDAYDATAGAGGFYAKCGYREVGRVIYRNAPLIYYELLPSGSDSTPPPRKSKASRKA